MSTRNSMGPSGTGQWIDQVRVPVSVGLDALRAFLPNRPPSRKDQVVWLFEHIFQTNGKNTHDERFEAIFEWLPEAGRSNISWIGVFQWSMESWEKDAWDRADADDDLECSPITKLIWDRRKEVLYDRGAIHACAEYGLDTLLNFVIGHLVLREGHNPQRPAEILFQKGPDSHYTPLGVAIWKQRLGCIDTLICGIGDAARDYIREHMHRGQNILGDDDAFEPLIHQTLAWARESASVGDWAKLGMDEQVKLLKKAEPILRKVIDIEPQFLALRNAEGLPAYKAAQNIRISRQERFAEFTYDGLEQIIRRAVFRLEDVDDVIHALYSETAKELCLDLSDFNYESHQFEVFVEETTSFRGTEGDQRWEFEDTLLYLILPKLRHDHDETLLDRFLECLSQKGVQTVNKLRLPDTEGRYSCQFVANSILKRFKVHDFDWLRLDADIEGLADDDLGLMSRLRRISISPAAWLPYSEALADHMNQSQPYQEPELTKFHVYSQKNFPKLGQFKALERIRLLQKVDTVELHPVKKPQPQAGYSNTEAGQQDLDMALESRITDLRGAHGNMFGNVTFNPGRTLSWEEFVLKPLAYDPARETSESKVIEDLEACHNFISALRTMEPPDNLETKRCVHVFDKQRVKIAVLDNGFDHMGSNISSCVASGRSFVKVGSTQDGPYLPWFTAADRHGTQMAHLIFSVNPWCVLYLARVACLRRDVDADAAAKAIDWALSQRVDIISISWIVTLSNAKLQNAITRATRANVLIFCSTADFGAQSAGDVWPAHYENIIAVSASNSYGLPRVESDRDVHVMFHGDQIRADGPKYMMLPQDTRASGSSVSTALAAGLGSLCLFLARMANPDGRAEKFKRRTVMLAVCRKMQSSKTDRVIVPSKLFNAEVFEPDYRFQYGSVEPPRGLKQFRYNKFTSVLNQNKADPWKGHVPRRKLSRTRLGM